MGQHTGFHTSCIVQIKVSLSASSLIKVIKAFKKSHCTLLSNSVQGIFQAHTNQAKGCFQKNLLPSPVKCLTPLTSLSQVKGMSPSHPHP